MKTLSISLAAVAGITLTAAGLRFSSSNAMAQVPPKTPPSTPTPAAPAGKIKKLADISKVNIEVQKTPQFQVQGPKEKRTTPKEWLEFEVDLKMEKDPDAKGPPAKTYPQVTFKYYAYLTGADAAKNRVITGEVVHVNVPIGEVVHSVMYLSPATLQGVTEGKPVTKQLIKAHGIQVFIGGEEVGRDSSEKGAKSEWWKGEGMKLPQQEAAFLEKSKTPFAPLWWDYHLETSSK